MVTASPRSGSSFGDYDSAGTESLLEQSFPTTKSFTTTEARRTRKTTLRDGSLVHNVVTREACNFTYDLTNLWRLQTSDVIALNLNSISNLNYVLLRSTTADPIRDVTLDNNLISGDDDYDEEYYYYDDDYYEYEADLG